MPPQALAALVTLLGATPHGNRIELKLDRGRGEMLWVSPSAFRFRRTLGDTLPVVSALEPQSADEFPLEIEETSAALRVRSRFLEVTIQKSGVLVTARRADGSPLMSDL